jgi:hypothetical protein
MTGTRGKRKDQLTDAQIWEKVGNMLGQPQKVSHLTAAPFLSSFLALTLGVAVPPTFKETGALCGKVIWIVGLIWTLMAALGWKRLPPRELKRLPKEEQHQHYRLETIWFHFWKGGYLVQVSAAMLLIGLGGLSALGPVGWVSVLAVAGYLLTFAVSFCQRRRILRVKVEGWSADTQWGRLMLCLAVIGPAAGAAIGSTIGIAVARLHVLSESVVGIVVGLLGILIADMVVPQVVQDLLVAWIHLQIRRTEMNQAAKED